MKLLAVGKCAFSKSINMKIVSLHPKGDIQSNVRSEIYNFLALAKRKERKPCAFK